MKHALFIAALLASAPAIAGAQPKTAGTTFIVKIENVSTPQTLRLANGGAAAPIAPGVWVVSRTDSPVFASDTYDRGKGLESLAEDGDPGALAASLKTAKGVLSSGVFDTPVGDDKPGIAGSGKAYEFKVEATPGCRLHFNTMFAESNDAFYSPLENGIPLFDAKGQPVSGDVTRHIVLWDAGTEVNQAPGAGADQALRQAKANTGASEHNRIAPLHDAFEWPGVDQVLRVTITPTPLAESQERAKQNG